MRFFSTQHATFIYICTRVGVFFYINKYCDFSAKAGVFLNTDILSYKVSNMMTVLVIQNRMQERPEYKIPAKSEQISSSVTSVVHLSTLNIYNL